MSFKTRRLNPFLTQEDPSSATWLLHEDALILEKIAILEETHDKAQANSTRSAYILRDDLLHPFANGNKLRKLDRYLPALLARGITDILTCGGAQSAHCAAVACLCAERGMRAHILLRGEAPTQITGNLAITLLYAASVTWIERNAYADRHEMLTHHAQKLARTLDASRSLYTIPEGAAEPLAIQGLMRLIERLRDHLPHPEASWRILIDSGTGTSAAGLLAGVIAQDLPWTIRSVMLMPDQREHYTDTIHTLVQEHLDRPSFTSPSLILLDRAPTRRFGKLFATEIARCQHIAQNTGVLFDPIYTLAAYDALCQQPEEHDAHTLLIHTGGALNMLGVMSRKPHLF